MKKYKLKNCCNFIDYRGKTPEKSEDGYRLITAKNVKPLGYCDDPKEYIPIESYESVMVRGIPRVGDILFTTEAPLGNVGRIPEFTKPFAVGQRLIVIQPNEELLDYQYMVYKLRSNSFQEELLRHSSGSTVRGIRSKELIEIEIEFPELLEQKKVSKVFSVLERIIETRKIELLQLDDLIKARFVELFGLPVSNSMKWKTDKMQKVAPSQNYLGEMPERVWLLNLDMVESQTGRIIDYLIVSKDEVGNSTCIFDDSTVLYSKLRPYLNKVVIPKMCGYATSELVPLKPNISILNREYLAYLLRSDEFVSMISEKVAGAKMPRVSMGDFRNFDVPIPPMELQEQFASFVEQIDKSKFAVQKALDEAQTLFDSLMQEYFG